MKTPRSLSDYRKYLAELDYPEYAHADTRRKKPSEPSSDLPILDLSLWGDTIHPGMIEAVRKAMLSISKYHEAQDPEVLKRMSDRFGYPQKSISIVAGADDALRVAAKYCIRPGTKVLIPVPSFGRYEYHAYVNEADIHYLRFDEYPYKVDIRRVAEYANKHGIECIFLANPNSPTGSAIPADEIRYLLESVKASVILDESLLIESKGSVSPTLLKTHENLFVCGSFSKLFSLAGVRVGYLVVNRKHQAAVRQLISPFEVSSLAVALAKFVLLRDEWSDFKAMQIKKGIARLRNFQHPSFRISQTCAPIALLEYIGPDKRDLHAMLKELGILTISGKNFRGLENANAVRIIIRNERDITQLLRRLQKIS
ncbi:MAG TPA: aminotransferase class I/II-fold pyridoxal phosphate-dependent enzyme [Candidatus Saccharimonadales bacterium]